MHFEHRAAAVPQFSGLTKRRKHTLYTAFVSVIQWQRTCQSPFSCFSSSSFYSLLPAASSHKVDQAPARTILCSKIARQSLVEGTNN
uniref:Uncharacterized protein n=1 Tax=Oryza barthii TaxID=65489 RepID=A0A0D3HAZ5_9ORYZ